MSLNHTYTAWNKKYFLFVFSPFLSSFPPYTFIFVLLCNWLLWLFLLWREGWKWKRRQNKMKISNKVATGKGLAYPCLFSFLWFFFCVTFFFFGIKYLVFFSLLFTCLIRSFIKVFEWNWVFLSCVGGFI